MIFSIILGYSLMYSPRSRPWIPFKTQMKSTKKNVAKSANSTSKAKKSTGSARAADESAPRARGGMSEFRNTNVQLDGVARTPFSIGTRVEKRSEYWTSIYFSSSAAPVVVSLELQPGLDQFLWLSRIARNYDMHRLKSMTIEYRPACPSTAQGMVTLGIDYDSNDAPPATRQQLASFAGAATAAIRLPFSIRYDHRGAGGGADWRLVRSNSMFSWLPGSTANSAAAFASSLNLFDFGTAYAMSSDGDASIPGPFSVAGDLYVVYEWEFKDPQIPLGPKGLPYFRSRLAGGTTQTVLKWFGDQPVYNPFNYISGWANHVSGTIPCFLTLNGSADITLLFTTSVEALISLSVTGTGLDDVSTVVSTCSAGSVQRAGVATNTPPATGVLNVFSVGDSSVNLGTTQRWSWRILMIPGGTLRLAMNTVGISTISDASLLLAGYPFDTTDAAIV